jgi:nucleoside-diphosphate-sugar epimerase
MEEEERVSVIRGTFDISNSKEQLGYQPQYDLRRGIADYIAMQRQFETFQVSGNSAR